MSCILLWSVKWMVHWTSCGPYIGGTLDRQLDCMWCRTIVCWQCMMSSTRYLTVDVMCMWPFCDKGMTSSDIPVTIIITRPYIKHTIQITCHDIRGVSHYHAWRSHYPLGTSVLLYNVRSYYQQYILGAVRDGPDKLRCCKNRGVVLHRLLRRKLLTCV
jgi:hypothetical protein